MNGFLALVQQAAGVARTQASALWHVLSAIAANKPEPARNVVLYTLVLAALLFVVPKIVKLIGK